MLNFIYPASEDNISKYSAEERVMLLETPEIYFNVSKPKFIDQIDFPKANGWIYNILERKKEVELTVFENQEFILNVDWEFNDGDVETLYCLAMPL